MRTVDLIEKKRNGLALTKAEIDFLIGGYTTGEIPDYQMAAWAMAVYFRGMTREETVALTQAMEHSGDTVDLSAFGRYSVDKHSTGGVGDKTTLIVAPIVASLGGKLAKMSGRGLGHTGGTVDKLESIPGFQTTLTPEAFRRQVEEIGVAVIGQSGDLTPADKKLYALRDVTATVDSMPLIASSILSKKLAAGAKSIVLDVKCGSGAFMKTEADGRALAETMVSIGSACGRNMAALITNMDLPLGMYIGNALEVMEAVDVLRGKPGALRELCSALAAQMLSLCHGWTVAEATERVIAAIDSGRAMETMGKWVAAQGGDAAALTDFTRLPQAAEKHPVLAQRSGYLTHMDAEGVGIASSILGAGRRQKGDTIDPAAGIVLEKTTGDYVEKGEVLAWLHTNQPATLPEAEARFTAAMTWGEEKPEAQPLIYGIVRGGAHG